MPGPCETHFLGKPAMLANGTAHLALMADALIVPMRARRVDHHAWADVDTTLDPRDFAGPDELHNALAVVHERWILENPAALQDPREIGWEAGATPQAWVAPTASSPQ